MKTTIAVIIAIAVIVAALTPRPRAQTRHRIISLVPAVTEMLFGLLQFPARSCTRRLNTWLPGGTEASGTVSAISPNAQTGPSATPRAAETSASATARSAAGSSTLTPPATFTKTSC